MSQLGAITFDLPIFGEITLFGPSKQQIAEQIRTTSRIGAETLPMIRAAATYAAGDSSVPIDFRRQINEAATRLGASMQLASEIIEAALAEGRRRGWITQGGEPTEAFYQKTGELRPIDSENLGFVAVLFGVLGIGAALVLAWIIAEHADDWIIAAGQVKNDAAFANGMLAILSQAVERGEPWAAPMWQRVWEAKQKSKANGGSGGGGGAMAFSGGVLVAVAALAAVWFAFRR